MKQEETPSINGTSRNAQHRQDNIATGLSAKLLWLTILFIMFAEILIFVPSMANFRNVWLKNHLETAEAAVIIFQDADQMPLSNPASEHLMSTTRSVTIAFRKNNMSQLIASHGARQQIGEHIDLDKATAFSSIVSAFRMLFGDPASEYRVYGSMLAVDGQIELVQKLEHIQQAMWVYARNILFLSLLISVVAAVLVYLALYQLIVRPIIRISSNMDAFSKQPENASLIYNPSRRGDEIGIAEQRLASFQEELRHTLRQKQRLANLGLAVSKINHDLRNILASAQLFSDRLTVLPDPTVQRFAPKLIRTIDRAVEYTKSVIDYGRALESPPSRRPLMLKNLVDDVAELLGLDSNDDIEFRNLVDEDCTIDADPEQLFRVLLNLCRNSQQAMTVASLAEQPKLLEISAELCDLDASIRVRDNGPGIAPHIRDNLFIPYNGSTKSDGSGLGMAIAKELVTAHDGMISVEKTSSAGTTFLITLPNSGCSIVAGEPVRNLIDGTSA